MIRKYMQRKAFKTLYELLDKINTELHKTIQEAKYNEKQENEIKTKIYKTLIQINEVYDLEDENGLPFTEEKVMSMELKDLYELLTLINNEVEKQI